ncbi:hypothetical protein, partial [Neisseria lactamica]|uniref:hypothetical protein n=1 Tax=Neisseria lactamica TaxID=486 RepID=UPI0027DFD0CC
MPQSQILSFPQKQKTEKQNPKSHHSHLCEYKIWGCTRLADMLPSKYEDNTLQIKEKSTER